MTRREAAEQIVACEQAVRLLTEAREHAYDLRVKAASKAQDAIFAAVCQPDNQRLAKQARKAYDEFAEILCATFELRALSLYNAQEAQRTQRTYRIRDVEVAEVEAEVTERAQIAEHAA